MVAAGDDINADDFAGELDDHESRIGSLEVDVAAVEPTTRLKGINAMMDGAIGSINPAVTQAYWQGETVDVGLDANGEGTVPFAAAFQLVVQEVQLTNANADVAMFSIGILDFALSGVDIRCHYLDGNPVASITVSICYAATGL